MLYETMPWQNKTIQKNCILKVPFSTSRRGVAFYQQMSTDLLEDGPLDTSNVLLDGGESIQRKDKYGKNVMWKYKYDTIKDNHLMVLLAQQKRRLGIAFFEIVHLDFTYPIGMKVVILEWDLPIVIELAMGKEWNQDDWEKRLGANERY